MDSRERLIRRIIRAVRNGRGADFYETVREFDLAAPDLPRTGSADRASGELLRFTQRPSLSEWPETVTDLMQQDASAVLAEIRFFGLCGVDGPMPLGFTEAVCQRTQNEQDPALQRFLDILNHRFIALLYRAFAAALRGGEEGRDISLAHFLRLFIFKIVDILDILYLVFIDKDEVVVFTSLRQTTHRR